MSNDTQKLTHAEFEVLCQFASKNTVLINALQKNTPKLQWPKFNKTLDLLTSKLLVTNRRGSIKITQKGLDILEQYRVKRAIILAAGRGSRLMPATKTTPKPLVYVGKKRLIETQIDALHKAGIEDITIVRGYLGHKFDVLLDKYPNLKFIDNPHWEVSGSIISVALASHLLADSYVLDGDLYIYNTDIVRTYEHHTSYCGIEGFVEKDWHLYSNSDGCIQKIEYVTSASNKRNIYKFVGLMFWPAKSAKLINNDLNSLLINPNLHQQYIESMPFDSRYSNPKVKVRPVSATDVYEIDTQQEHESLKAQFGVATTEDKCK